jgi:hypothetical protein
MHQNSVKGLMNNNAKVSSFTKHISKGFINVALGAITNLKMNMPHGVRCVAKGLDHRDLWTTSSPKQSDWHQWQWLRLIPTIEKKSDQRRSSNHR